MKHECKQLYTHWGMADLSKPILFALRNRTWDRRGGSDNKDSVSPHQNIAKAFFSLSHCILDPLSKWKVRLLIWVLTWAERDKHWQERVIWMRNKPQLWARLYCEPTKHSDAVTFAKEGALLVWIDYLMAVLPTKLQIHLLIPNLTRVGVLLNLEVLHSLSIWIWIQSFY